MFRHARSILFSSALVVGFAAPPLSAAGADCIEPPGGTVDFENPDLEGPGMPTSAEIAGATVWEYDLGSPNDPMGDATVGDGMTSVPLTNNGGNLAGPSGRTQNGGSEGKCIEVFVKWKIKFKVIVTGQAEFVFGGGFSAGGATATEVWAETEVRSAIKEVCPC